MQRARVLELGSSSALCFNCGIPLDAKYFDESGVVVIFSDKPGEEVVLEAGTEVVLARFELSPQYCGVLEYFAQFTDQYETDSSKIKTDGLEWVIVSNGHPLYPYVKLDRIVNPWGNGSFQIAIRLDEGATIEFVVRLLRRSSADLGITLVGGRIVGRYWYNTAYGAAGRNGR
ncbi:MAG: hypothetical protein ACREBC_08415 [Pyrinomonadaceae bacterium]